MKRWLYPLAAVVLVVGLVLASFGLYWGFRRIGLDMNEGFLRAAMLGLFGFLLLLILRYLGLLWFSFLNYLEGTPSEGGALPFVSVLVPAYNEGITIEASLRSLVQLDYPSYEVIVIDDGSSDDTYRRAQRFASREAGSKVRVVHQANAGKAQALNTGIRTARASVIVCVDADSALAPESLRLAAAHLQDPAVGAVAGNVKVVNRDNVLGALQALEYVEGLNMCRNAQAFFRTVSIVPGPIGMFRRDAVLGIGGYESDTFAEDCDLTLRLLAAGWQITYEPRAIAYTEAPEHLLDLLKQRYRWTRGILQALRKHKRLLFDPRSNASTTFALWYMIFEGLAWPAANVLANVIFAMSAAVYGISIPLVLWWGQLTVLDLAAALYCVLLERERLSLVPYAVLYRVFFSLTIDISKLFATLEELLNLRMEWGKLDRIGRI